MELKWGGKMGINCQFFTFGALISTVYSLFPGLSHQGVGATVLKSGQHSAKMMQAVELPELFGALPNKLFYTAGAVAALDQMWMYARWVSRGDSVNQTHIPACPFAELGQDKIASMWIQNFMMGWY
ncbi:hypothetical protein EVAR_98026_1 [Eumeta japonica]|uniref:Uncharacterized protein n=1 Tax=Eumeta variegata TaxID=151549 RepID=A0A4C2A5Z5_EUMVA|nr:hypothetical protein EVAR_98026_1 [Eumeta japonica]